MTQKEPAMDADSEMPGKGRSFVAPLLFVLVAVPVMAQLAGVFSILLFEMSAFRLVWQVAVPAAVMLSLGYLYGKKARLADTFAGRYGWFVGAVIYILLIWCAAMWVGGGDYTHKGLQNIIFLGYLPFIFLVVGVAFEGAYHSLLSILLAVYPLVAVGYALGTWRRGRLRVAYSKGMVIPFLMVLGLAGVACWQFDARSRWMVMGAEYKTQGITESDNRYDYQPFSQNSRNASALTPLKGDSMLTIASDFPRLDGATALFPIYASAVQGVYQAPQTPEEHAAMRKLVDCSRTPTAYQNLIDGKVDLIFVAGPSAQQVQAARAKGLALMLTPIGKEAFVFLVNEQNPVHTLTVAQIRGIYAGEINRWREVGGMDAEIRAFQRPAGSGSQSTMISKVMQGTPLQEPLKEEFFMGMGDLVVGVANYRNAKAALGYSFRYYATRMKSAEGVRLLAVNGVEPTRENIRNASYPFIGDIYMVTARPVSENTQKLMDWFVSSQGQQLIEDVGYVSLSAQ